MLDVKFYRNNLLDAVYLQAEFRREKAIEYPDDDRNTQSADALDSIRAKLDALPDGHFGLLRHARFWEAAEGDDVLAASNAQSEFLRTYGFDGSEPEDANSFLDSLIGTLEEALADAR